MKLTNYLRDAFISAVMQDVPRIADHSEEIRKLVVADVLSQVPKPVKEAFEDSKSRQYLKECSLYFGGVGVMVPNVSEYRNDPKLTEKGAIKVKKLTDEIEADNKKRKELVEKIRGVAYGCNTLKQLKELLPEFIKYMPEDDSPIARNLPVVTNIVSDFKKAGWKSK